MDKIRETAILLGINFLVAWRNLIEYFKAAFRYYGNFSFCKIDHYLILSYLCYSPFSVSKRFHQKKKHSELYVYGETPLTTLDAIMEKCGVTSADTVYELGCGRARSCFWLNQILGCKVVGIDEIPEFIDRARWIKERFEIDGASFHCENMLESDFSKGTVFYLYGTSFPDSFIKSLAKKLSERPSGTKVITVSYPLTDYDEGGAFEIMRRFTARFTWGCADVYLQVRR